MRTPAGGGQRNNEFQAGGRPSAGERDRRNEWPDRSRLDPDPRRPGGERGFPPRYLLYRYTYFICCVVSKLLILLHSKSRILFEMASGLFSHLREMYSILPDSLTVHFSNSLSKSVSGVRPLEFNTLFSSSANRGGAPLRSRSRSPLPQHSVGRGGHPHEMGAPLGPMEDAPRVGPLGGRVQLPPSPPPANSSASSSFHYSSNWRSGGGEGTSARWQPSGWYPTIKDPSVLGGLGALSSPVKFGSQVPPQRPVSNLGAQASWNAGGAPSQASHQQQAFGGSSSGPSHWNSFGRR